MKDEEIQFLIKKEQLADDAWTQRHKTLEVPAKAADTYISLMFPKPSASPVPEPIRLADAPQNIREGRDLSTLKK